MDRKLWQEHLAQAERHIREGEKTVARQRLLVATLERDGHEAAAAQGRDLLARFEKMLEMQIADRDRLLSQLGRD